MFFNKFPYTDFHELNLDFLIANYKKLLDALESIDGWIDEHEQEYTVLKSQVDALESGNWSDEFIQTLISWYEDHIVDIIGELIKHVFFGLNDQGYFVAYIPDSWDDITFGTTGYDDFPVGIEFGHLTLSY